MRVNKPYAQTFSLQAVTSGVSYTLDELVLLTQPTNLLAYWPINETSGVTIDNLEGTAARDGTATSVTLNNTTYLDGNPAGLFPGAPAGRVNIYSTSLRDAMSFNEGTLMLAYKPQTAGVWSDSTTRRILSLVSDATADRLLIDTTGGYYINVTRIAGGTKNIARYTNLNRWIFVVATYSRANDQLKLYINGDLISTSTGLGAASGNTLNSTYATIGAYTNTGTNPSSGWIGRVGLWKAPLTGGEVTALYDKIKQDGLGIFVLGDSKSAWNSISGIWTDTLIELLTTASGVTWVEKPYKIAVGGYDVGEMDTYLQANLSSVVGTPTAILISMGANDIPAPTGQVDFESQLTSIITQCQTQFPGVPIYVSKPYRGDEDANSLTIAGYVDNVVTATGVNDGPDETVWFKNDIATYSADNIHYNAAGALEAASQWLTSLIV